MANENPLLDDSFINEIVGDEKKKPESQSLGAPTESSASSFGVLKSQQNTGNVAPPTIEEAFKSKSTPAIESPQETRVFSGELPIAPSGDETPTQKKQQEAISTVGNILNESEKKTKLTEVKTKFESELTKQEENIKNIESQIANAPNEELANNLTQQYNKAIKDYEITKGSYDKINGDEKKINQQISKDSLKLRYEKDSPLEVAYNAVKSGSESLGANILRSPKFTYDIIADGYNTIARNIGGRELLTGDEIAKKLEMGDNEWAKWYEKEAKTSIDKVESDYDKSSVEYINNGEYGNAFTKLVGDVMQSVPTTIGIMAASASGVSPLAITLGGGAVFGAGEKQALDTNEDTKNLPESTKLTNAFTKGMLEGITENWGVTKLGKITLDIAKKVGQKEAIEFAEKGFKEMMKPLASKYLGNTAEEVSSEVANTFLGNVTDVITGVDPNKKFTDGLAETALTALGTSALFSSAPASIEIKRAIANKYQSKEFVAKTVAENKSLETFDTEIKAHVENGILTPQEGEKIVNDFAQSVQSAEQIPNNISNVDVKAEAIQLLNEKAELAKKDKVLSAPRLAEIDEQLDAVANGSNYSYKESEGKYFKVDNATGKESPITKTTYDFGVKNFEENKKTETEAIKKEAEENNKSAIESTEKDIIIANQSQIKKQSNGDKEKLFKRLSQEEQQGMLRGGRINEEAAILTEGVHRAEQENVEIGKPTSGAIKEVEEEKLLEYAKDNGVLIEDDFGTKDGGGRESDIYYSEDGKVVTKINSNVAHDSWKDFFDRIAIHNSIFPSAAYTIEGFTIHKGKFSAVLKQDFIQGNDVSHNRIKKEMEKLGFEPMYPKAINVDERNTFVNRDAGVIIEDLHGANAVVTKNGRVIFIDPIIKLTEERKQEDAIMSKSKPTAEGKPVEVETDNTIQDEKAKGVKEAEVLMPKKSVSEKATDISKSIRAEAEKIRKTTGANSAFVAEIMDIVASLVEGGAKLAEAIEIVAKYFSEEGEAKNLTDKEKKQVYNNVIKAFNKGVSDYSTLYNSINDKVAFEKEIAKMIKQREEEFDVDLNLSSADVKYIFDTINQKNINQEEKTTRIDNRILDVMVRNAESNDKSKKAIDKLKTKNQFIDFIAEQRKEGNLNTMFKGNYLATLSKRIKSATTQDKVDELIVQFKKTIEDKTYRDMLNESNALKSKIKANKKQWGNLANLVEDYLAIDENYLSKDVLKDYNEDLRKLSKKNIDFTNIDANIKRYMDNMEDGILTDGSHDKEFVPSLKEANDLTTELSSLNIKTIDDYKKAKRLQSKINKHLESLIAIEQDKANPDTNKIEDLEGRIIDADDKFKKNVSALNSVMQQEINSLMNNTLRGAMEHFKNIDYSKFTAEQQQLIKSFKNIDIRTLKEMGANAVDTYEKLAFQLTNGYISPSIYKMVDKVEGIKINKDFNATFKKYLPSIVKSENLATDFLNNIKGATVANKNKLISQLANANVALKDSILGMGKDSPLFKNIHSYAMRQVNKMDAENGRLMTKFEDAMKKADSAIMKTKRILLNPSLIEGARKDMKVKLGLILNQMNYEARPDYEQLSEKGNGDVFTFLKDTKPSDYEQKPNTNDLSVEEIQKIYDTLPQKDGKIDVQKAMSELSPEEKNVVKTFRDIMSEIEGRVKYSTEKRSGVYVKVNDYFPQYKKENIKGKGDIEKATMESYSAGYGIAGKSNSPRTGSVHWVDLDIENAMKNAVESANRDFYLADMVAQLQNALNNIISENRKEKNFEAMNVLIAIQEDFKNHMTNNLKTRRVREGFDKLVDSLLSASNMLLLANPERIPKELVANLAIALNSDPKTALSIVKDIFYMSKEEAEAYKQLLKDTGSSMQFKASRLTEGKPFSGKEGLGELYSKKLASVSDATVSSAAYKTYFEQYYKELSGKDFDYQKYLTSEKYRDSKKIKEASTKAEKITNEKFSPQSTYMQSEKVSGLSRKDALAKLIFNLQGYQQSQSKQALKDFNSILSGKNKDRTTALLDLMKILGSNALFGVVGMGISDWISGDDDEDKEFDYKKLGLSTLTNLLLGGFGNVFKLVSPLILDTISLYLDKEVENAKQGGLSEDEVAKMKKEAKEISKMVSDFSRDNLSIYYSNYTPKDPFKALAKKAGYFGAPGVVVSDFALGMSALADIATSTDDSSIDADTKERAGILFNDLASIYLKGNPLIISSGEVRKLMLRSAKEDIKKINTDKENTVEGRIKKMEEDYEKKFGDKAFIELAKNSNYIDLIKRQAKLDVEEAKKSVRK